MTTAILRLTYGVLIACSAGLLSSCGGGGGGVVGIGGGGGGSGPTGTFSLSTNSISFQVRGLYAQAPANQTLTGTVTGLTATSGILYITVSASHPKCFQRSSEPRAAYHVASLPALKRKGPSRLISRPGPNQPVLVLSVLVAVARDRLDESPAVRGTQSRCSVPTRSGLECGIHTEHEDKPAR